MDLDMALEAINLMSEVTGYRTEAAGMKRVAAMLSNLEEKEWKNMTWEQKCYFCDMFTKEGYEKAGAK